MFCSVVAGKSYSMFFFAKKAVDACERWWIENYLFWKEFLGWIAAWMAKTHREQSLAKPSTNHILILIPVRRQSDSYILSDDSSALRAHTIILWSERRVKLANLC